MDSIKRQNLSIIEVKRGRRRNPDQRHKKYFQPNNRRKHFTNLLKEVLIKVQEQTDHQIDSSRIKLPMTHHHNHHSNNNKYTEHRENIKSTKEKD